MLFKVDVWLFLFTAPTNEMSMLRGIHRQDSLSKYQKPIVYCPSKLHCNHRSEIE